MLRRGIKLFSLLPWIKKAWPRFLERQAFGKILSTFFPQSGWWLDFKNGNYFFLKFISHVWVSKLTTCRPSRLGHAYIRNEEYCQEFFCGYTPKYSAESQIFPLSVITPREGVPDTYYFLTFRICSGRGMIPRLLPDGWWRFKNSGPPTTRWLVHRFRTPPVWRSKIRDCCTEPPHALSPPWA